VLLGGSPMDVTFAKNNRKIGSILWAGYPGQAGAPALAQIIFGEHNPGEVLRCLHSVIWSLIQLERGGAYSTAKLFSIE